MTLQRVISVTNTGRLKRLAASGDVTFSELTLIYGDNGSGKTTLASVLSSLASGDPAPILERATLGVDDEPTAQVLSAYGTHRFDGVEWSEMHPSLEVFDDAFVRENVYAGDAVDVEQRKNLYQVVVGPTAVSLAREVDALDAEGRALARNISTLEGEVRNEMQTPFDLQDFIDLPPQADLDEAIAQATRELSAARNAQEVMNRPDLSRYPLPDTPRAVLGVLEVSVDGISEEAERRVRLHFREHLDERGEAWVRQGLGYTEGESCPFCGQSLDGVDLVEDFRLYFSEAYREHIVAIQRAVNEVERHFDQQALGEVQRVHLENHGRIESWRELLDLSDVAVDLAGVQSAWRDVRNRVVELLRSKLANPSNPVQVTEELEAALQDYESVRDAVQEVNTRISEANERIARFKQSTAAADQSDLEAELRRLRNTQIRHSTDLVVQVEKLLELREKKRRTDEAKEERRERLRSEAQELLASYETDINTLLQRFGASFRIRDTRPSFAGGRASSMYKLAVNDVELELGNSETPRGTPCFRTALSSGDKSTLALAFFLARLRRKDDLAATCVVLDDPLTSLDAFRTSFTQQTVVRLAADAAQVVVLSHDPFFLKGIADHYQGRPKTLRLTRTGDTYTLRPWDVEQYCLAEAHKDYFVLRGFLEEGLPEGTDLITVARSIRPYIEGALRHLYPGRFSDGENLGSLVAAIRDAEAPDDLAALQDRLKDLEDLNAFSRRVHHAGTGGPPAVNSEAELQPWVELAIDFVRRR